MSKSGKWKKFIESSLAAAAFAEANVPEVAREILDEGDRKEWVLFAARAEDVSALAVRQAVNLCRRLDCGLALLLVYSPESFPGEACNVHLPSELRRQIEVPVKIHPFCGPLPEGVQEFMDRHRRVISVVLEDSGAETRAGRRPRKRSQQSWWQNLSCPVVLVPVTQEA